MCFVVGGQFQTFKLPNTPSRTPSIETQSDFSDFQLVDSPLLQIWIPAAMIRGEGVKKHHVYQVVDDGGRRL